MSGRYVDEVVKMKPTKGHHLTRYRMIIAKEDMVVANVRREVGWEDSCLAQPGRMGVSLRIKFP
jgi:hypothetical protein